MATDQEIRDRGIKFLPLQKYLQNPYEFPVEEETAPVPGGITNTNAFTGGGGDNFSVYNPDPNSIVNRTYNPRPYYDATYEDTFGANAKDPLSNFTMTGDPEILARGDTGGQFYEPPPSKLEGLMSMLPYAGAFTKGAKFLGNQIGPYLPTNRRSIMENQLSGQGIMVNDIGQIVQGQGAYDTAANVMAGYNANKLTAESFDKRIEMAKNKMSAENKGARIAALEAAKADFLNAQDKTDKIFDFEEEEKKKKKKNTIVGRFFNKKKEKKAAADAIDLQDKINAANAAAVNSPDNYGVQGLQRSGSYGGNATYSGSGSTVSQSGDVTNKDGSSGGNINDEFAKGGRAGYFFGGRVNYKVGGRVSFKNGGLAGLL